MNKFSLNIAIVVFLLISLSGLQAQTMQSQPGVISFGTRDVINSKILNEQREVWVYLPNSASDTTYSKQSYPVVYLLDGEWNFSSFAGMIEFLSSNLCCPEMIVVGIPNTDRTRDLTPTHMDSWKFLDFVMDSSFCKTSGGGESFISFIEKELMPHIDSLYPTAPYRIIVGHSAGGLTVMNTLIHHTNLFNSYVSIDPAMAWDNQKLLKETKTALATNTYSGVSLFLGIANTMGEGMDTIRVKKDTTKFTEYIRSNFELRNFLDNNKQNQLKFSWRYYNNDNHSSVPLITEYDAFRFIFDYYHFDKFHYTCKEVQNLYEDLSKQFGYKVKPPESMVNDLAYFSLFLNRDDESLYLFKLNVTNYPDSWNVYNSLGDYYDTKGDKTNAIENYKKALAIKYVHDIKQKLEKLQGK